jgi:hypothetical protein
MCGQKLFPGVAASSKIFETYVVECDDVDFIRLLEG